VVDDHLKERLWFSGRKKRLVYVNSLDPKKNRGKVQISTQFIVFQNNPARSANGSVPCFCCPVGAVVDAGVGAIVACGGG
jgi:hypothetical protein